MDQSKLRDELEALGVIVTVWGETVVTEKSLTAGGDFQPGVAAKLILLEPIKLLQLRDLPAFGVGAARTVAAIPVVKRVNLWRTNATPAAVAALGECPDLDHLDLNNGDEFPIVTDAGLAGLAKLKNLKVLTCERSRVTPAGLAAIGGLTKLEELNLSKSSIDDTAMSHVAKLVNLTSLNLAFTKVTGKGLATVSAGATKLSYLNVDGTGVTDADLPALAALPELSELSLGDTRVTDAGMIALAKSKSLSEVSLHRTKVTDAGIVTLAGLPKLWSLTLYNLPLTDASLDALVKAPNLRKLRLNDNLFTAEGLAKFATARPKVTVGKL